MFETKTPNLWSLATYIRIQARRLGGVRGVRTNSPHAGEGPPVRAVSGRGNIAGPWDAKSKKREREVHPLVYGLDIKRDY